MLALQNYNKTIQIQWATLKLHSKSVQESKCEAADKQDVFFQ